jgi:hypothetical protein
MHRTTLLVAGVVALLVAFAGCAGGPPAGTETGTPTATDSPTVTATDSPTVTTTSPGTHCPAFVEVDAVSDVPDDAAVIPYEDLSAERRAEFDAALSEGNAEVEDGGDGYEFWVDRPYVRYEGTVYRAVVAVC